MFGLQRFKGALKQAQEDGKMLNCFPILCGPKTDEPLWEPLSYKLLKEIKQATANYRPTSPYTRTLSEKLSSRWVTPYDWFQVVKALLTEGNFLLRKVDLEFSRS